MQSQRAGYSQGIYLLQTLTLATLYIVTGQMGLSLAFFQENATLIWPPTGLSLAALILFGPRLWTGVLLGALFLNMLNGSDPVLSLIIAIGNTAEAWIGSQVMVRFLDFRPTLERVRDVVVLFIVGGIGSTFISASLGITAVWLFDGVSSDDFNTVLLIWWRGNIGGVISLTPLILLAWTGRGQWARLFSQREFWLVSAAVVLSCVMAFGGSFAPQWEQTAANLPFACLVWAGIRLGIRGAVLISVMTLAMSATGTAFGQGPFAVADSHASMTLLWSYGMGLGTVALTLAAAVTQRDVAELRHETEVAERQRMERAQLLSRERERIMREMHDGLGGQLVSVLSMVQRGQAEEREIAEGIRRALDDMRIMIDSLETSDADFVTMLGKLRARIEPILKRNGLELTWRVDSLPALAELEPESSLHCLRIIQESISNVIQHAEASEVWVEICADDERPDAFRIEVRDDGIGFNGTPHAQGRGTRNILARAEAMGAELRIEPADPGRRIRLVLPPPNAANGLAASES